MVKYRHYIILVGDILIVVMSFLLAMIIKDEFIYVTINYSELLMELPFIIVFYIISFELFGMYKSLWIHASVEEVLRGGVANLIAVNVTYILLVAIGFHHFNYSLYVIAFLLASMGTIGMRLSYRLYRYYTYRKSKVDGTVRTLIVGAGNAGVMLLGEIYKNDKFNKKIIGFIDDDKYKVGLSIRGFPILGTIDQIETIAKKKNIDSIIIAIPSLNYHETKEVLNKVETTGCKIKLMPPFFEMVGSKQNMFEIRDIEIEDLLGRDQVVLEETGIKDYIEGKTIVVTGGGGSIGSEIVRQLRHFGPSKIIIIDIYENNAYDLQQELCRLYKKNNLEYKPEIIVLIASVRDRDRINEIFLKYKPDVVFHAAAHKHVPLMEVSPREALKNNVLGTYNVAMLADKHNITKFVLISTDKAVRPTSIMGASKRIAEKIIMAFNEKSSTDYAAVRFGNVLGSNGSVIPLFKKQIEDGGPVTVTHKEITRFFMTIPEACQLVIQTGGYAKGGELFILDMGKPIKIIDLAEKMIRLTGREPYTDIEIQFTGLRPGEKMYEELLKDCDTVLKTTNNKIYIEKNNNGYGKILVEVEQLFKTINEIDVLAFIKKNVKGYIG